MLSYLGYHQSVGSKRPQGQPNVLVSFYSICFPCRERVETWNLFSDNQGTQVPISFSQHTVLPKFDPEKQWFTVQCKIEKKIMNKLQLQNCDKNNNETW